MAGNEWWKGRAENGNEWWEMEISCGNEWLEMSGGKWKNEYLEMEMKGERGDERGERGDGEKRREERKRPKKDFVEKG